MQISDQSIWTSTTPNTLLYYIFNLVLSLSCEVYIALSRSGQFNNTDTWLIFMLPRFYDLKWDTEGCNPIENHIKVNYVCVKILHQTLYINSEYPSNTVPLSHFFSCLKRVRWLLPFLDCFFISYRRRVRYKSIEKYSSLKGKSFGCFLY